MTPIVNAIRSGRDIACVFDDGRKVVRRSAVLRICGRDDDAPGRVAFVAGRGVGPAVARNRAKRRLRHALREVGLPRGYDIVVVARATALRISFAGLVDDLQGALAHHDSPEGGDG